MRRLVRLLAIGLVAFAVVRFVMSRRAAAEPSRAAGAEGPVRRGRMLQAARDVMVHSFNPLVIRYGLAGGAHSPWGIIEHIGRTTGHAYRTPVAPRPIEGGFEIPLAFGADVHWVKNLQEAGHARLQFRETLYELEAPEVVDAADAGSIDPSARRTLGRMGYRYLRVRTVASMPGTFSHLEGHEAPITRGEPVLMAPEGPFGDLVPPVGPGEEIPSEPRMVERATAAEPAPPSPEPQDQLIGAN
jgi:deazaflavin-dependent oxidoreductase (nitroreductase family)